MQHQEKESIDCVRMGYIRLLSSLGKPRDTNGDSRDGFSLSHPHLLTIIIDVYCLMDNCLSHMLMV